MTIAEKIKQLVDYYADEINSLKYGHFEVDFFDGDISHSEVKKSLDIKNVKIGLTDN